MKKILWVIPIIIVLSLLPAPKARLVDIATGLTPNGFFVVWPPVRYLFEPFVGLAACVLSFTRYMVQMGAWLVWIGVLTALYNIVRKKKAVITAQRVLFAWLVSVSFILFAILAPLPAPRLEKPAGYTAIDLHSHTHFSHDGVVSPAQSLVYHRDLGFDRFFVTEHGHTSSFAHFPKNVQMSTVLPGMQVQTTERISLLVLADQPYNGADFTHRPIRDLIRHAHARGFVVICPHWWKWRQPSWEELYADGIDGFEIYNAGYRKFSDAERANLVRFCGDHNLIMTGSTDWHGWGRISDVWTVAVTGDRSVPLFEQLRRHAGMTVLVYRIPGVNTTARYLFEPFVGLYYYFGGLAAPGLAGWIIWIFFIYCASFVKGIRWFRILALGIGTVFAGMTVYCLVRWMPLLPENQILGRLLSPILFAVGLGWFLVAWRDPLAQR